MMIEIKSVWDNYSLIGNIEIGNLRQKINNNTWLQKYQCDVHARSIRCVFRLLMVLLQSSIYGNSSTNSLSKSSEFDISFIRLILRIQRGSLANSKLFLVSLLWYQWRTTEKDSRNMNVTHDRSAIKESTSGRGGSLWSLLEDTWCCCCWWCIVRDTPLPCSLLKLLMDIFR